jgi:hypothetical protein
LRRLDGLHDNDRGGAAGQHDDRLRKAGEAHFAKSFESIATWHSEVEQNEHNADHYSAI